jgi:hypothetical protein
MISYYKYTQGDAFTLDGNDYHGMVHVIDGVAFTGGAQTQQSKQLTSKNTFASEFILTQSNYNLPSFTNKLKQSITPVNVYPRATLNIETLTDIFDTLHKNNILLYSSGIRYDSNMFNLLYKNDTTLPSTFTLSAKGSTPKSQRLPLNVTPLSIIENEFIDEITQNHNKNGSLFISLLDEYKYYNNNSVCKSFAGSLSSVTFEEGLNSGSDFTHEHLFYNRYDNVIYQTNNENFCLFSYDFRSPLNTVSLIDKIDLTPKGTPTNLYNASYSRNYRSVITTNQGVFNVEIYPTDTTERAKLLSPEDIGVDSILRISQRFEDDMLVVLCLKNREFVLCVYDVIDLITKDTKPTILNLTGLENIPTWVELSDFDSDLVFLRGYTSSGFLSSFEARSLSNPTITNFKITQPDIYNIYTNTIINKIDTHINLASNIVLRNTVPLILDIQFSSQDRFNSFLLSDHFILTDSVFPITSIIPTNLPSLYDGVRIEDNSIGLGINSALRNIIQDTVTLYYTFTERFTNFVNTSTEIPDITIDDFFVYGNESINVSVLNRVIDKIYRLQSTIADRLSL